MRVLFLSDDFPPYSFGGAGVIACHLALELKKQGHEIFIITTVKDRTMVGRTDYFGMSVFRIYIHYHERWRAWLSLYNPSAVKQVKMIIEEVRPDIVHVHNIHYYLSYYCLKIAKQYAKAVFLTAHDVMFIHYGKLMPKNYDYIYQITIWEQIKTAQKRYNPFRNLIIRYYLKYLDKIFTVSNSLRRTLEINNINNIATIYNGIDVANWHVPLNQVVEFKQKYNLFDKKVILFGGRLSGAKGGNQILRAMALIKKEIDNIVLLVMGERNEYVKKMENLVKQLNIEKNIIFTGWLKEKNLKVVYQVADVCIVPSICFDSFPTVNLEAMSCHKPVIATCFGGSSEIVVDQQTGYIVNPLNITDLADKIIDLLTNPIKAKQFGEAGYQRVKDNFSLKHQATQYLDWYNKFLD